MLTQAFEAAPSNIQVLTLLEALLVDAGRTDEIASLQRKVLDALDDGSVRSELAFLFGIRWATRHQNLDLGAQLAEEALRLNPRQQFGVLVLARGVRNA